MSLSLLHGDEDISRLHNILGASIIPFDVGGVLFLEDGEGLLVNDKFPLLSLDCAMEFVMSRIIPEHIDHVVEVNEGSLMAITLAELKCPVWCLKSLHSDLHHHV